MFLLFLYIVIKFSTDKKPFTEQSWEKKRSILFCVTRFVISCVCSSMSSLRFASSTTKHTTDIQTILKLRHKQRTLCLFCCFAFVVAIWGYRFFVLYMAYLPWDAVVAFFSMQQFLTLFDKHRHKSIHDAHNTLDISAWTSAVLCAFHFHAVERADCLISQWRWSLKVDCWTLPVQLFTVTQGGMPERGESSYPSNFLHLVSTAFTGGSPHSLSEPRNTAPCL